MLYDKSWTFNLNQAPALQDTLQHQCQSFLSFLKSNLLTAKWTVVSGSGDGAIPTLVNGHTCTKLSDDRLLLIAGHDGTNYLTNVYFGTVNGGTITWVAGTALPYSPYTHQTTLLSDGRILVTGGSVPGYVATTYFGTISGNTITWTASTALPQAMASHQTTLLSDGRVFVSGGYNGTTGLSTTYFGTISGNTITWASGTALSQIIYGHGCVQLGDGRLFITGGYNGSSYLTNTYFGTISGNTVTWVAGSALPTAVYGARSTLLPDGRVLLTGGNNPTYQNVPVFLTISGNLVGSALGSLMPVALYEHETTLLSNGSIVITGGSNGAALGTAYFGSISGTTITWTYGTINTFFWNTGSAVRTWILLASPVGFVPGPDGSYKGAQSQMYLCIECVGSSATDYSKINLTFYSTLPTSGGTPTIAPFGGNAQGIAAAGTQFINSGPINSLFHFATTQNGGFYAGISAQGTNTFSTLLGFLDLADVQQYGNIYYPYPVLGFCYYNYASANLAYSIFDSVVNTAGVKCFNMDGTAGTPRALVWCNPNATIQIAGTGLTVTGDINGNVLDTPIYMYNATSGKIASMGRIPDFKGTGATGLTNGALDNAATPFQCTINQLLIPANAAFTL